MGDRAAGDTDGHGAWLQAAALVPGLGHLLLGRRTVGGHLLGLVGLLGFVLVGRWEAVQEGVWGASPGEVLAAWVLLAALGAAVIYSVWDVGRLLARGRGLVKVTRGSSGHSPWQRAWRRFRDNRLALVAVYVLGLLSLAAVLAPILTPYDPTAIQTTAESRYLAPSWAHPFGTDKFGRDLLSRSLYGARVSLAIGLLAMLIAVSFGTLYGAVAAYVGGWVDDVLMRMVDVLLAFPTLFLLLTLVGVFEADLVVLVLILGFTSWTGTARFVRGEVLSLKEREFVDGARALGLPDRTVLLRHLIPNALTPVFVNGALMVGGMITAEAALSFLGLGVQPPTPSWGQMISAGQERLVAAWWVSVFPGALLSLTVLSFNLLADGFRDALDPKSLLRKYV